MARDEKIAFIRDCKLHPRKETNSRGEAKFDGSLAQKLLCEDVKNKLHEQMTPSQLQASRPEYKPYKSSIFKQRIYQEEKYQKFVFTMNLKRIKDQQAKKVKKEESVDGSEKKEKKKARYDDAKPIYDAMIE